MTDAQLDILFGRIERGLQLSVQRTLRTKALHERDVVYAGHDGVPFRMSARDALREYEHSSQTEK